MIDLNPKNQFNNLREEDAKKFANVIVEPFMRTALTYAFAQLGHTGVTPEELNGAKKFLVILSGMAEENEVKPMPQKSLLSESDIQRAAAADQIGK